MACSKAKISEGQVYFLAISGKNEETVRWFGVLTIDVTEGQVYFLAISGKKRSDGLGSGLISEGQVYFLAIDRGIKSGGLWTLAEIKL